MSDDTTQAPLRQLLDVMVDLETMGTGPLAPIVAIGAVLLDPIDGTMGARFYTAVDLASSVETGAVIDPSTVLWWLRQGDEARAAIAQDGAVDISHALVDFHNWLATHSNPQRVRVWGNGASFDNVILAQAYRMAKLPVPWRYTNDRCYRTIKAQHPDVPLQRTGTHHNALDDAETQALHLIAMMAGGQPVQP